MGSKNLNLTFYTDDLEYTKRPGLTIFISPFGAQSLAQVDLIFPINHPTEFTFIDISSQGEPFKQHICFKGPIKDIINLTQNKIFVNNTLKLFSYTRIFSKPLFLFRVFDTVLVNSHYDYDSYLSTFDTRSSLVMNLASKQFAPLDCNFKRD